MQQIWFMKNLGLIGGLSLHAMGGSRHGLAGGQSVLTGARAEVRRESCIKLYQRRILPQMLTFSGRP
jgi:hypothetical protein